MTPARLISDLQKQGLTLSVSGDKLVVEGPKELITPELKAELIQHKPALMRLCRCDWSRRASHLLSKIEDADRRVYLRFIFEERAAIGEFDGNLARDEAERRAYFFLQATAKEGGVE